MAWFWNSKKSKNASRFSKVNWISPRRNQSTNEINLWSTYATRWRCIWNISNCHSLFRWHRAHRFPSNLIILPHLRIILPQIDHARMFKSYPKIHLPSLYPTQNSFTPFCATPIRKIPVHPFNWFASLYFYPNFTPISPLERRFTLWHFIDVLF